MAEDQVARKKREGELNKLVFVGGMVLTLAGLAAAAFAEKGGVGIIAMVAGFIIMLAATLG
jgi:hypothetical protein